MSIEVKLPELGDGIESGDVLDVLVSEGDVVSEDQPLCEIETDKATVPIPSSHAGKVLKVHVTAGDSVPVGGLLVTLEATEAAPAAPTPPSPQPAAAAESARRSPCGFPADTACVEAPHQHNGSGETTAAAAGSTGRRPSGARPAGHRVGTRFGRRRTGHPTARS